jgi:hypothetical protein
MSSTAFNIFKNINEIIRYKSFFFLNSTKEAFSESFTKKNPEHLTWAVDINYQQLLNLFTFFKYSINRREYKWEQST